MIQISRRRGLRRSPCPASLALALAVALAAYGDTGSSVAAGEDVRVAGPAPTETENERATRSWQATGLPLPRFVSLRAREVNVRAGPGVRYPVKWVFVQSGLPVEITAEFETWRKIRDAEGAEGWVHRAMLSAARTVVVTGETQTLRRRPNPTAPAVARAAPGLIAAVDQCNREWCLVSAQGYRGWLPRGVLWGLYPEEELR